MVRQDNSEITTMPNKENIEKHQFKKGQSGNPKGRPKKVLTKFKEMGYTKSQVRDTYAALSGMTKAELDSVTKDKDSTALEVSIARAFTKAMAKGEYRLIKDIVELFADKPKQVNETQLKTDWDKVKIGFE